MCMQARRCSQATLSRCSTQCRELERPLPEEGGIIPTELHPTNDKAKEINLRELNMLQVTVTRSLRPCPSSVASVARTATRGLH